MSGDEVKMGAAATPGNLKSYATFVASLRAEGKKFPRNQFGDVSIGAVANKVICGRDVLKNGSLAKQFAIDVTNIGVEEEVKPLSSKAISKKAAPYKNEASELKEQLNLKIVECDELRTKVVQLSEKIDEFERNPLRKDDPVLKLFLTKGGRFFELT